MLLSVPVMLFKAPPGAIHGLDRPFLADFHWNVTVQRANSIRIWTPGISAGDVNLLDQGALDRSRDRMGYEEAVGCR